MGKEFSLAVAAVAVSKAFDQSPRQGFLQIGREVNNLFTRTQEIVDPLGAYFVKPLEVKNSQIFWEGYDRSITASLRRNAALLRLNKAPKAEYEKAKAECKNWKDNLEPKILGLTEGQGVQFLALRELMVDQGISLQQVSMRNGRLVLESQLMPFNQLSQVENFQELLSEGRENINLPLENENVDSAVSWAVQGQTIDFKQDLPEMIIGSMLPEQDLVDLQQPIISAWPQLISTSNLDLSLGIDRVTSIEPSSFWWQILTSQAGTTINQSIIVEEKVHEGINITSGSEFEVIPVFGDAGKIEATVGSAGLDPAGELEPALTQETSRSDLEGQREQAVNEVVIFGELSRTVFKTEKQIVRPKQETVKISKREQPTRRLLVGKNDKSNKTSSRVLEVANIGTSFLGDDRSPKMMRARGETSVVEVVEQEKAIEDRGDRIIAGRTAATRVQNIIVSRRSATVSQLHNDIVLPRKQSIREIPELKINLEPLNEKEIPVGQIYFDDNNEAVAWFIVIAFFLITNTKSLQPVKIFTASRGRG